MIQIKNLGKYYGEHKVLHDISLSVEQGDVFGIVGHSGAGKSTLLRCLNGLEDYSEGTAEVMGHASLEAEARRTERTPQGNGDDFSELQPYEQKERF